MENRYLIKLGELTLRKQNLGQYTKALRNNIKRGLVGTDAAVETREKRMYVIASRAYDRQVRDVLDRTFGIAGYALVVTTAKTPEAVAAGTLSVARTMIESRADDRPVRTFRITARRADKGFPLNSSEIGRDMGSAVLEAFPQLEVNLKSPDMAINIEIRERAYLYAEVTRGLHGLPVGVSGTGMLLLSGGIDSPVAGYLMAKRGMHLNAIHFHTYPVTSIAAQQKAKMLGRLITPWTGNMRLFNVPIYDIQKRIQERARVPEYTLLFRAAMMRIASTIAVSQRASALITGESLGQVASQTPESMQFTGSNSDLPVFRPLIAWDKEEIMELARKLGTFKTATMPFQDCCSLFAPEHPLIHPRLRPMQESFARLELDDLMAQAQERAEIATLEPLSSGAREGEKTTAAFQPLR